MHAVLMASSKGHHGGLRRSFLQALNSTTTHCGATFPPFDVRSARSSILFIIFTTDVFPAPQGAWMCMAKPSPLAGLFFGAGLL